MFVLPFASIYYGATRSLDGEGRRGYLLLRRRCRARGRVREVEKGVKLLVICPIPVEFRACRETLGLRDSAVLAGCRTGRGSCGGAEILAVESGPAKARSSNATTLGCVRLEPDLVVDTGSCAGVEPGGAVGQFLLGLDCHEYDIGGDGFPVRAIPEMRLPSALSLLRGELRESLLREAADVGAGLGHQVRVGNQACGEFLVRSVQMRELLHSLFQACGANWETAGVFVAALRSSIPPLSIRVVTDLGDEQALSQFRSNVKTQAQELYRYLRLLLESGWFGRFLDRWAAGALAPESLPEQVLPRGG
jgi:nucleoside phosphorylase